MRFAYEEAVRNLPEDNNLSRLFLDRWFQHLDGGRKERTICDLALVQAMIFPEWAETSTVTTSKDNGARKIHYFSSIDAIKMKEEFFRAMNDFMEER